MNTILQKRIEEVEKKIIQEYVKSFRYENGMELEPLIKTFLEKIGTVFFEHGISFALQNQWISVEEALPVLVDKKSGQSEVVFARVEHDNVFVAYYDYSNEHWYYNNHYGYDPQIYYKITHWMPIPSLEGGEE